MSGVPRSYRVWFYAAAAYNLLWGAVVCAVPRWCIELLGIEGMVSPPFLQVLGMVIGVFAYGYWLLARDPERYCGLVWIAIAGKVLGPLGFLFYVLRGELPWSFGQTIIFNDLVWLPAFFSFAFKYARCPVEKPPAR
jgi:small multidrug resistance pump